jgi:putative ABC transport system substrate-binding protein
MAFATLVQNRVDGLMVTPHPLFIDRRVQIITLAARHTLPAIYSEREIAAAGGLMSYGPVRSESIRLLGVYVGRILKGEKPADLPVMRATKFEFVINLQTARTFGIEVPATLPAQADEVIE